MTLNMAAAHAVRPAQEDTIFGVAAKAAAAAKKYGAENIVNSTIGALLEDDGSLVAFKSVYGHLKGLNNADIASYAALAGQPDFLEKVQTACFGECRPDAYIKAVATPGGTGAVRHAVYDYTDENDFILTSDWYWDPYKTICEEYSRRLTTYTLFDEKGGFNFTSFKAQVDRLLALQHRLLVIINTPAHNPTGYTVSDEEWDEILAYAKEKTVGTDDKLIILCDVAYIDFAGENSRGFFRKFTALPENLLILVAYSASKSYTMYGLRNGAALCISSSKDIADEFYTACAHSNRGTWSNGTRGAMQVLTDIYTDKELYAQVEAERNIYRALLKTRGDAFLKAADAAALPITNYKGGFFVSVPCADAGALCDALIEKNIFTVPLQKGIRLALCAINESQCAAVPAAIKEALSSLD